MTATIARGRVLREILKQDRLAPLSEAFQMAWLVAFNDGLFTDISPEQLPALLTTLQQRVEQSTLDLNSPRKQWTRAAVGWVQAFDPAVQP